MEHVAKGIAELLPRQVRIHFYSRIRVSRRVPDVPSVCCP